MGTKSRAGNTRRIIFAHDCTDDAKQQVARTTDADGYEQWAVKTSSQHGKNDEWRVGGKTFQNEMNEAYLHPENPINDQKRYKNGKFAIVEMTLVSKTKTIQIQNVKR